MSYEDNSVQNASDSNNNNVISYQAREEEENCNHASKLQSLGVRIPGDVLNAFRTHVCNKYGKLNGVFAQEIKLALIARMNDSQQQATNYAISTGVITGVRSDVKLKLYQIAKKFSMIPSF